MSIFDKIKGKFGEQSDRVKDGVDKVADKVDDKTGGKYGDRIDTAKERAKEAVDRLDEGQRGDQPGQQGPR